ncbi:MAG TPA: IclR family transcriptional regulator [Mycobacteriales bacterium]|nr:IclR family transcriptional regulator [Mycobacteriales bacterium]
MSRRQYRIVDKTSSGVGVIDKAVRILDALEPGPASLAALVARSGLPRPTAYRLAVALEVHGIVARDARGRFALGPRLGQLSGGRPGPEPMLVAAPGILARLRDHTGESAQLYRREGFLRRCVAVAERPDGLRDTVPVGALLPLGAGSGAQVLLAWEDAESVEPLLDRAVFSASTLVSVRRRGWAASVAERESGVASVSAPVFAADRRVVAAVSVSGPIERLSRSPGRLHARAVVAAGEALTRAIGPPPAAP